MVARAGALDERVRSGRMPSVRPRADDVVSDPTGRALRASRQQLPTAGRGRDARANRLGTERLSIGRQRIAVGCPHHDVPGAVPAARIRAACSQHRCRGTQHGTAGDAAEQRLDGVERRRDASSSRVPAARAGRVTQEAQCSAPGLPHFSATRSKSPRLQCLDDRMSASTRSNRASAAVNQVQAGGGSVAPCALGQRAVAVALGRAAQRRRRPDGTVWR